MGSQHQLVIIAGTSNHAALGGNTWISQFGEAIISNSLFRNNKTDGYGGGINLGNTNATLYNTVFSDNEIIFQAMCSGASGYILKNDPPAKYLEAISEVYNGGAPINSSVAKKLMGFFSNKNVILVAPTGEDFQLTKRELELLNHMMEGLNYKDIAEKAYISYDTVRECEDERLIRSGVPIAIGMPPPY